MFSEQGQGKQKQMFVVNKNKTEDPEAIIVSIVLKSFFLFNLLWDLEANFLYWRKILWTTYKNIDTVGEPPLICGQQSARATSKDNMEQNMNKDTVT